MNRSKILTGQSSCMVCLRADRMSDRQPRCIHQLQSSHLRALYIDCESNLESHCDHIEFQQSMHGRRLQTIRENSTAHISAFSHLKLIIRLNLSTCRRHLLKRVGSIGLVLWGWYTHISTMRVFSVDSRPESSIICANVIRTGHVR